MSQFYDEMAELVIDLIGAYGFDIPITRTTGATISSYTAKGLIINPQQYVIPPVSNEPADERIIVDRNVRPKIADRISMKGRSYTVTVVKEIQPADVVLGYRVDLRLS